MAERQENVVNRDTFSKEFCYKTAYSKQEIQRLLETCNGYDVFRYRFDADKWEITFYKELQADTNITYTIYISEFPAFTILKIVQKSPFLKKNYFYQQNKFWSQKIKAEVFPYFK